MAGRKVASGSSPTSFLHYSLYLFYNGDKCSSKKLIEARSCSSVVDDRKTWPSVSDQKLTEASAPLAYAIAESQEETIT
jgi:hypothetical protein